MIRSIIICLSVTFTSFIFPDNEEIKLDGIINEQEWTGAEEYDLSAGEKLFVLQKGKTVYLGIKASTSGWGHVYLQKGDSVNVLHASAALGSQLYKKENETWKRVNKFNWEVRESVYNETLIKKQNDYFKKNGWCANNTNTGDKKTIEFKIDAGQAGFEKTKFGVVYISGSMKLSFYPSGLNDDTLLMALVTGGSPDVVKFNPASWVQFK